jgi:prepilin-type N-terminal cleavage/methylation domain-containing protein/prepilin-type processing-associated H-X9-DG protein
MWKKVMTIQRGTGFTLVELLVVITIIGILIALLLPAVQAAREAARRIECSNHVKQLATGCLLHENANGYLPSGGWGTNWLGDPNQGFGKRQPGGWVFSILPYIEQQAVFDIGAGATTAAELGDANAKRIQIAIPTFTCPTRRPPGPHARGGGAGNFCNCDSIKYVGHSCYAINVGTMPSADGLVLWTGGDYGNTDNSVYWANIMRGYNGVSYVHSEIAMAMITDGTSNTYLVGEKYVNPDTYLTGTDGGDDWNMYLGHQDDQFRAVGYGEFGTPSYVPLPPKEDRPGDGTGCANFGSAHAGALNMSLCDGSVRSISYDIDPEVHRRLGNREDGLVIDGASF